MRRARRALATEPYSKAETTDSPLSPKIRPAANLFLLAHKCGNNYVTSVFRGDRTFVQYQTDDMRGEMPGPYISEDAALPTSFANVRCRNFTPISVERALRLADPEQTRVFLFVRHPASFFRSAVSYHLRGNEQWAVTNRYGHLEDKTLHRALTEANTLETRLIIAMKHFGLAWGLPDRWVQCYGYLVERGIQIDVVKTEELFSQSETSYFDDLAARLSHSGYEVSADQLMAASPGFMKELPAHATGEFLKEPLDGYSGAAREMYDRWFLPTEEFFYGPRP